MIKIGICIPTGGQMHTDMVVSLVAMLKFTSYKWGVYTAKSCIIPKNRRILTETALKDGCTHILMIDSDMEFPPNLIEQLMAREKTVVAANCVLRKEPLQFTAQINNREIKTSVGCYGIEKVDRVGTAIMLIHAAVFRKINKPWFMLGWNPKTGTELGEDYMFCQQCTKHEIDIYIDHDLSKEIKHLGHYSYGV